MRTVVETAALGKVKRWVVCHDRVPNPRLCASDGIMGLGQFLNVARPGHHRILKYLHRADLDLRAQAQDPAETSARSGYPNQTDPSRTRSTRWRD